MTEDMEQSAEVGQLAKALAAAQADLQNVKKAREVQAGARGAWTYADLADGLDVIRPALSKHGIAFTQFTSFSQADGGSGVVTITTQLTHAESGQWMRGRYPVAEVGLPHQEMGSAITYARRYALFPAVGVAGVDDDDDGEKAGQAPAGKRRTTATAQTAQKGAKAAPAPPPVDAEHSAALLNEVLDRLDGVETTERYSTLVGEVKKITAQLTPQDYERMRAAFVEKNAEIAGGNRGRQA